MSESCECFKSSLENDLNCFANEGGSPNPSFCCPLLGILGLYLSKGDASQVLLSYAPRLAGTGHDGCTERRSWMYADWLIRVCAPEFLDSYKIPDHAAALRALSEVCDPQSAKTAHPFLVAACQAADAHFASENTPPSSYWVCLNDFSWSASWTAGFPAPGDIAWYASKIASWYALKAATPEAPLGPADVHPHLRSSLLALFDQMVNLGKVA